MDEILKKAIEFATKAHGDQMRKYTPEPYIVHPIRVMGTCRKYTSDLTILIAALFHDILEDTPVTKKEIEEFLLTIMTAQDTERTLQMIADLTDVYVKKDYPKLNRRARKTKELERIEKTSPDSQTIKYADIIDNVKEIVQHDPDFAKVFLYECRTNLKKIPHGNQQLYLMAKESVDKNIQLLNHVH